MSIRVLTKVFQHSEATLGDRLVLIVLADSASDDGVTWVSQETIAEKARVSDPTVRRALRSLEESGEVETRKAQRGRRRINVYRVVMPGLAELDYDRLPFTLVDPFATTEQSERSSDADDRRSTTLTTADPDRPRARGSLLNRKENRKAGAIAPDATAHTAPPKLEKVDGRDIAFDALAAVCRAHDRNAQREVGLALNGTKGVHGIRQLAWDEITPSARLGYLAASDSAQWEHYLAQAIDRRARAYVSAMPAGSMLTPLALAKWWGRVEGAGGLTSSDVERIADEAVRGRPRPDYDPKIDHPERYTTGI